MGQRLARLIAGPLLVVGILAALQRPSITVATVDQERDMVEALAPSGTVFRPLESGQQMSAIAASPVGVERAAATATDMYGRVDAPVVYEGLLTLADVEPRVASQPVYAVQLTGLDLPAFGGNRGQGRVSGELVVFVDAESGTVIVATSVR